MKLNFFAGVEYKNKVFFSAFNINGLFEMDLETNSINFLKLFEKEEIKPRLHRAAFIYENEAWFIPQEAEYITCVNLDTFDVEYYNPVYNIASFDRKNDSHYHMFFTGHVILGRYILLVPGEIDTFLIIDMKTHLMHPVFVNKDIREKKFSDAQVIDNKLWMFPWEGDEILIYNFINKEIESINCGYRNHDYDSVIYESGKLWFAPNEAKQIMCIDIATMTKYFLDIKNSDNKYSTFLKLNNELLLCNLDGDDFIKINIENNTLSYEYFESIPNLFLNRPNKNSIVGSTTKSIITTGENGVLIWYKDDGKTYVTFSIEKEIMDFTEYIDFIIDDEKYKSIADNYRGDLEKLIGLSGYIKHISRINKL